MSKGICKKCGRELTIRAQGLCNKCYKEEYGKSGKADGNGDSMRVVLDFSLYPELFEGLKEVAHQEFRDLPYQIFWCIKAYVGSKASVESDRPGDQ